MVQNTDDPEGSGTDRIVEAIVSLDSESRRATKELARKHGLTDPQVTALKLLEGFEPIRLSDLSQPMSARNSTLTGIADRTERDGLMERVRSEADRRVVLVRLTSAGRALAARIPVASMEVLGSALDERDRELQRILRLLSERVRDQVAQTQARLPGGKGV